MKRSHIIPFLAALMLAAAANAQMPLPASISTNASAAPTQVTLSWPAVSGATSYNVKRSTVGGGPHTQLSNVATNSFTDSTAMSGTTYFYAVTTLGASGESAGFREVAASPGVIVDNNDAGSVTTTGTLWLSSTFSSYYGTDAKIAATTNAGSPTATFTFTPTLPLTANYDVYLRWTSSSGRPTNVPVDISFADAQLTVTVDQTVNGGTWMLLGTYPCESGTATSVTIRNNTGSTGKYVVADAIQFVPRLSPWGPASEKLESYTLVPVSDDFEGSSINPAVWSTFLGRGEHSVSGGRLHTKLRYSGTVPIGSASTADLENEANWVQGGIVADQAQKFGYHEARLRLPQLPARGVDTAYWHGATGELLNGFEIDAPEFFSRDATGAINRYGFGVWDHVAPTPARAGLSTGRTWDYGANYSTLGDVTQYVTIGLEWRTDNSQVVYINGVKVYTAPTSGMNDTESILPSNIILSTKVLDWMHPNAALDGAESTWDYARFYQKPGWLGAVDGDWSKAANWGPDGLPAPGYAAVFNVPTAPGTIFLPADQSLQSLFLDSATLPACTFNGPGTLRLGAAKSGDTSVTHGGILVNTTVPTDQTFNTPVVGLQNLQFANLSLTPGVDLILNGLITSSGSMSDVDFVTPMAANATLGKIVLGQPLGSGWRHINKAGDTVFALPANSQHTGELRIARGPVTIASLSSLGVSATSSVVFRPRYKHSDSWRPRLTYTGPAATSAHGITLGGWQADGILESSGSGPLTWTGSVTVAPYDADPKKVLTRLPTLTLGGTNTGNNIFSGAISDAGVIVTYKNADGSDNTGPAVLSINKAGSGTWTLTGGNAYSGSTSVGGGILLMSSFNSVNGGTPLLASSSLGAPMTVDDGTIDITSGTLRYTGPGETTDRVINIAGSSGATLDQSGGGLLMFTSDLVTTSSSSKTLTLTGSTTGVGEIAGAIPNFGVTTKTSVAKSGSGTWTLSGANTYTGTTTVNAGTLVVNGSIANGGTLTVSATGTLTGSGTIATTGTIAGTLVASPLTFTKALPFGNASKLRANFTGNSASGVGTVTVTTGTTTITSGAKVDVVLNGAGGNANFIHSYWRTARTIPLLGFPAKTGTFALSTPTADSAGHPASTYGAFSLQHTNTAVNLLWTPTGSFPIVDDPGVSIASPAAAPVSLTDNAMSLRVVAVLIGGTTTSVTWSQVSGPGAATFANATAADTTASFSVAGTYVLRATASNALGSAFSEVTLKVAPVTSIAIRQSPSDSNAATFIRGDIVTWNSGARTEMLIGKTSSPMRALLGFDLSGVPANDIASVTLDLWTTAGSGTVGAIELHSLTHSFVEGTGNGSSASNGQGTGADWSTYDGVNDWTNPGGDYDSGVLASIAGYDATTAGVQRTFDSTPALVSLVAGVAETAQPLGLMILSPTTESGTTSNVYTRFVSDDSGTASQRPLLTINYAFNFAPTTNPGTAPTPLFGASAALSGTVTNATGSTWIKVSGPGTVTFGNAAAPSTTAVFSAPGAYVLRLSGSNANGETSRTLSVTVISNLDSWRQTWFGTLLNSGTAADTADANNDGEWNLMEFATGQNPNAATTKPGVLVKNGANLEFTYTRSDAAISDGIGFFVEWSDTLAAGSWSASGVTQTAFVTDQGATDQVTATVPAGSSSKRFVRLKVTK